MLCGVSRTHPAHVQDTVADVFNCSHVIVVMVFQHRGFCNLMGNGFHRVSLVVVLNVSTPLRTSVAVE